MAQVFAGLQKYSTFFSSGIHIKLEKLDMMIPTKPEARTRIDEWLNKSEANREFFEYHKRMTAPVFGTWNYDK